MKLALILNVIDPKIGGVMIMGDRGTGKSTTIRALADLLPEMQVRASPNPSLANVWLSVESVNRNRCCGGRGMAAMGAGGFGGSGGEFGYTRARTLEGTLKDDSGGVETAPAQAACTCSCWSAEASRLGTSTRPHGCTRPSPRATTHASSNPCRHLPLPL